LFSRLAKREIPLKLSALSQTSAYRQIKYCNEFFSDFFWHLFFQESVNGGAWKYFSAVCWFYGKNIYDQYKKPIGLVATDWGGTPVEAWSSPDSLHRCNITGDKVMDV